jgi:hypothetical protein
MIKEPPSGFKIQVEETLRGTKYSWRDEESTSAKFKSLILHILIVCFALFFGLFILIRFMYGPEEAPVYILCIVFAVCILMVLSNGYLAYKTLKGPKPFLLILSPGNILYESGTISESSIREIARNVQGLNEVFEMSKKYTKRSLNIATSNITNLKLEREGEKQQLCLDYEGQRIEIGPTLSEPEREWLYEVLKQHCGIS